MDALPKECDVAYTVEGCVRIDSTESSKAELSEQPGHARMAAAERRMKHDKKKQEDFQLKADKLLKDLSDLKAEQDVHVERCVRIDSTESSSDTGANLSALPLEDDSYDSLTTNIWVNLPESGSVLYPVDRLVYAGSCYIYYWDRAFASGIAGVESTHFLYDDDDLFQQRRDSDQILSDCCKTGVSVSGDFNDDSEYPLPVTDNSGSPDRGSRACSSRGGCWQFWFGGVCKATSSTVGTKRHADPSPPQRSQVLCRQSFCTAMSKATPLSNLRRTLTRGLTRSLRQLMDIPIAGHWHCIATWGLDEFLQSIGVWTVQRLAASMAAWPSLEISSDGSDHFIIISHTALGKISEEIDVDGSDYTMVDGWGQSVTCSASWDGDALFIRRSGPQGRFVETRRVDSDGCLQFNLIGLRDGLEHAQWGRTFQRQKVS